MKLKILFIFILTILLPTFFLAYFGLLAVRSEQSIIDRSLTQKYRSIADIIDSEIETALNNEPSDQISNVETLEKLFIEHLSLFKDEAAIFDQSGKNIDRSSSRKITNAIFVRKLKNIPYYSIAVYENHPILYEKLEHRKSGLVLYVSIIILSVLFILAGGAFSLYALSKEWRFAEIKSEFVSQLSHDLRRPLTSIRMFSEMLKEGHVPTEGSKKEYYEIISSESEKLTHLANNILDFSRIEQGRIKYNFQEGDIEKVVLDVVERFKNYIGVHSRNVILSSEKISLFHFDRHMIAQAVMNLLSNADKYSPPGTDIEVRIFKKKRDVVIQVSDKGKGIAPSEHKKIFQRFYRATAKDPSAPEGSGLGLTLVKYTMEAHNGRVKVESQEGEGTTFSLILPI